MFHVELHGASVALLRMDDGKVNAMGPAFVDGFQPAWVEATADGRVVVLAGNAKAFCAGLDLKTLPTLDHAGLRAFVRGFVGLFQTVLAHPRPVVAAVDGPALAGGALLALCADQRLVGPGARLGLTETQVGVTFPPPVVDLARETLPAQEWGPAILGSAIRQGEECVARGWAHRLVASPEKLVPEALDLAAQLALLDAPAYAAAKTHLRGPTAQLLGEFLKETAGLERYVWDLGSRETMDRIARNFQRVAGKR